MFNGSFKPAGESFKERRTSQTTSYSDKFKAIRVLWLRTEKSYRRNRTHGTYQYLKLNKIFIRMPTLTVFDVRINVSLNLPVQNLSS